MFERFESLLDDVDKLALRRQTGDDLASLRTEQFNTGVGHGLIMLATGRMPSAFQAIEGDTTVSELRQQTARLVIVHVFLGLDSSLYLVLGASPDCTSETLRENYRRLMGLVHPDTRPIGFPEDSASRVNFAYSILSDEERRASYDAGLALVKQQSAFPPSGVMEVASPRQPRPLPQQSIGERIRAAMPPLQFGHGLLGIATLIILPTGIALFSMTERAAHPQIVEAKPKLQMSVPVESKSDKPDSNSANIASLAVSNASSSTVLASTTLASTADAQSRTQSKNSPISLLPTSGTSASQQLTLSTELASPPRSPAPPSAAPLPQTNADVAPLASTRPTSDSRLSPQTESASATKPTVQNGHRADPVSVGNSAASLAPVASPTYTTGQMSGRDANKDRAANVAPVQPSSVVGANTAPVAPPAAVAVTANAGPRIGPADASDVLVTLSSAYESGSISAFSRVLAPTMVGRRQVLSDYERVFQQTRQRSIRFTELKHKANGERIVTSGYAVVSTVDNENRASSQRIFLEIDIGRSPEGLKIERLHNFPLN